MTYPVDDKGNPRVDFVWGNMPLQPDDQRDTITSGAEELYPPNGEGNKGWSGSLIYPSEGLYETVTQRLSLGDQSYNGDWQDVDTRTVDVPADNHDIALTGWSNYPAFIPNYAGDGDTGLETVVPNVFNFTSTAAQAAIEGAGFVYASASTFVGALITNDGKAKTQSPAAGVKANAGSTVTVTFFNAPEVPNVLNKTEAAATTDLTTVGLVKGTVTDSVEGSTVANDGKVKSQSIAAGTTVDTGTAVALVLFNAPEVPDLIGTLNTEAAATLEALSLTLGTGSSTYTGATVLNNGLIKTQSVAADTTVDEGTAIDIVWYEAPVVPNLSGYTEASVDVILPEYALVKGTVTTDTDGATAENDGTVKAQSPANGTTVDAGTAVDIVLYSYAP